MTKKNAPKKTAKKTSKPAQKKPAQKKAAPKAAPAKGSVGSAAKKSQKKPVKSAPVKKAVKPAKPAAKKASAQKNKSAKTLKTSKTVKTIPPSKKSPPKKKQAQQKAKKTPPKAPSAKKEPPKKTAGAAKAKKNSQAAKNALRLRTAVNNKAKPKKLPTQPKPEKKPAAKPKAPKQKAAKAPTVSKPAKNKPAEKKISPKNGEKTVKAKNTAAPDNKKPDSAKPKTSAGRQNGEPKKTPEGAAAEPVKKAEEISAAPKGKLSHLRPSHNIYFSIEDLNAYFEKRESAAVSAQREKAPSAEKSAAVSAKPAVAPAAPKRPLAVATIFDILGLNPVVAKTHEKLEERDVPRKWKKYYKLLIDLRKHHSSGVEQRSEEVLKRSAKDDAGDLSSYGQHLADAGSESFERDMAYNLISNQKEILSEIEEAIKRIKNGTYGICEVTGKPIPESRLTAIPYTRCTKEGQEIKERQAKRIKANQRSSLYEMGDSSGASAEPDEESEA